MPKCCTKKYNPFGIDISDEVEKEIKQKKFGGSVNAKLSAKDMKWMKSICEMITEIKDAYTRESS